MAKAIKRLATPLPPTYPSREGYDVIPVNIRVRADQYLAMREIQAEEGVPVTQQIRRAIDQWLSKRGNGNGAK